jgi:PAS domain S-box-containing protein
MNVPLRLLIAAEPSSYVERLLDAVRGAGFEPLAETPGNSLAFEEMLRRQRWDAVLCDDALAWFDGSARCLPAGMNALDVPFIVLSDHDRDVPAAEALTTGIHAIVDREHHDRLIAVLKPDVRARMLRESLRLAEEELLESQEHFRTIFEAAPIGMVVFGLDGRFLKANRAFCDLLGYRYEELAKLTVEQVTHPDDMPPDMAALRLLVRGKIDRYRVEKRYFHKGGATVATNKTGTLLSDEEGHPVCVLAVIEDITARKEAEVELKRAKEAAEAASRAKSEFLAGISHDMRTPLSGILGMTEMALATGLSSEQRDYLEMSKASARALLTIINDLLDLSAIEAGKLPIGPALFKPRQLVTDVFHSFLPRSRGKGIELRHELAADVPAQAIGDPSRLRQVLMNLVDNAVKFTERGEVIIRLSVASTTPEAMQLQFSVLDTGIGIPPERRQRIFDAFEQGDPSIAKRYGGTGLGLAIASKLASLMGGRIWLESDVGKGSKFHFTVQVTPATHRDGLLGLKAKTPVLAAPEPVRRLRVLVAEDNPINRRLVATFLRQQGHDVIETDDGRAALQALENGAFDIALFDMQMPEVDGFEATALIRAREQTTGRRLPIVAMTAAAMPADRLRCLEAGIDAYLCKPFELAELAKTVNSLTDSPNGDPGVTSAAAD